MQLLGTPPIARSYREHNRVIDILVKEVFEKKLFDRLKLLESLLRN